jgi:hypothetical protein
MLDDLVTVANDAGGNTNRKELIAAIVATYRPSGESMGRMLRRYRTMTISEAVGAEDSDTVIHLVHHGPGPRKRAQK